MTTHQDNVNRRIRTEEYAMKHMNVKDALKDPSFSYRSDVITTSLYCACRDCIKYCCYNKPIKCIDPYLIDMKHTYWIYNGLVAASKTASTRYIDTDVAGPRKNEPQGKQRKRVLKESV